MAELHLGLCGPPSTPEQDYRLCVRAGQHHLAALFRPEGLGPIRGSRALSVT